MTTKTFTVVGIVSGNGSAKVRFANDMVKRIKAFSKGGCDRIDFIELPEPVTKIEALKVLADHADFQSDADQELIGDALVEREIQEAMASKSKTVKVKAANLDEIKARAKKSDPVTAEDVLDAIA